MWKPGRQRGGYEKITIFKSWRFLFDIHLLRIKEGAFVPPHKDEIHHMESIYEHHRCNIVIWAPDKGGRFISDEDKRYFFGRVILFRPDICNHRVTKVIKGKRIVLSIGWLRKANS